MAAVTDFQSVHRISSTPVTGYHYADGEQGPRTHGPISLEPKPKRFSPSSIGAVIFSFLAGGALLAGAAWILSKLITVGTALFGGL